MIRMIATAVTALCASVPALSVTAAEGMWPVDRLPKRQIEASHGLAVSDAMLEQVQLSSIRLDTGCSASLVSVKGLLLTNQHCVRACAQAHSTPSRDILDSGYVARTASQELPCRMEANQLLEIRDVTARVRDAVEQVTEQHKNQAAKAERSRIESECAVRPEIRCDVVSLYRGGVYALYKYRRYQDVRLVFVAEDSIAFFGGILHNFSFPRYAFDVALLRLYEARAPLEVTHYLPWSQEGATAAAVTIVSGHPRSTGRLLTAADVSYRREVWLPDTLEWLAELRGLLGEYQRRGGMQRRAARNDLLSVDNSLMELRGQQDALRDGALKRALVQKDDDLRRTLARNAEWAAPAGSAFEGIAAALETKKTQRHRYSYLEEGQGFRSVLFDYARTLVRAADELARPVDQRLREFRDSDIPGLLQRIAGRVRVDRDLEAVTLAFSLSKMQQALGADDPAVRRMLGGRSPDEISRMVVWGTRLHDAGFRRALWSKGRNAIRASRDPMLAFARAVDEDARAARHAYEVQVEGPLRRHTQLLARARFAVQGASSYPDGTFTLRVNVGRVIGWREEGRPVEPFTTLGDLFARVTGHPPFSLPPRWEAARARLNARTPLNFVTDNDIAGGSSGSPVVNARGELIGVVFDGNKHSTGGFFSFDEEKNRAVSVHSGAVPEVLSKVYRADHLVEELRANAAE
jgi:hypothetical protein